jgi:hypothetical protein
MAAANTSTNGYLTSTDWNTFNGKQAAGAVTSVTGTSPVVSSGGATPAISIPAASTSASGYLTSTDWNTFNGKYSTGGALGTPSSGTATNLTGLPLTTGVTGVLPVANGGNGTATPALVAGTNVTISGTWPNQTINSSGGSGGVTSFSAGTTGLTPATATTGAVTLAGTLAVANGGTGTTTPALVAGTNVTISGTWPNQTINSSGGGGSMVYPGAGIPLSTGTAWGTSYSTTGTGDVVLSTSPTLVTPLLGTPTSGNFSTGTFTWPTFNQNTTGTAANVTGTVAIANGGTGQTTAAAAITALTGTQTSAYYLRSNGTNATLSALAAADLTGTVAIASGGSGQTTAQAAMNAFAGAVTSGSYLRGNGTNVVMATIQSGDVPTLNQNTTGTAANVTGVVAAVNGGTGQSSYAVGDIVYASTTTALSKLADVATGNALISGGVGVAPSYGKIGLTTHVSGTLPTANGGTNLTSFTANGVVYASSTSALATGSALTFTGTNLGIGTSSPSVQLDIAASSGNVEIKSTTSANAYSYLTLGAWALSRAQIRAEAANPGAASGAGSGVMSFWTAQNPTLTEAMRIDATGNLLVGATATSASAKLYVKGSGSTSAAARFYNPDLTDSNFTLYVDKPSTTTTTSQVFIGFTVNAQGTGSGQINANGASQAAFGSFSDARLKENIVDLTPQLSNLMALRPVEFDYKDGSGHQTGFVAQEMQQVYSDAVGEQNGFLTVSGYGKTEARLIKAIQEQQALIESLTTRLMALEQK